MADKKLRPKYMVYKIGPDGVLGAGGMASTDPGNANSPFVLMPRKDPAAFAAAITYARYCEKDLASEIKAWLTKVAKAPAVHGTQGERNRQHLRLKWLGDIL